MSKKSCYTDGMDFLTIHELSVEFDIPARVLRYRFHQLRQDGKLTEGLDYRRDDFVDDQHFVWKINPVSFMRETSFKPVTKPAPLVNELDNHKPPSVTSTVNQPPKSALQSPDGGNHSDNHDPEAGSQRGNEAVTKINSKESGQSVEREMIDLLKGQLVVKDGQIRDLTDQTLKLNDLNVKLVGQTLQQADRIQTLLRLTGGKSELNEMVAKEGEVLPTDDRNVDNNSTDGRHQPGNDPVTRTVSAVDHGGSQSADSNSEQGRPLAA
jgi:hypothetical protein